METIVLSLFIFNHNKDFEFYNLWIEQDIQRYFTIVRKSATNASHSFTIENLDYVRKTTRSRHVKISQCQAKVNATRSGDCIIYITCIYLSYIKCLKTQINI